MAAAYQLVANGKGAVTRVSDHTFIPAAIGNRDYTVYQAWVAAGNAPDPAPAPPKASSVDPTTLLGRLSTAQRAALIQTWLTTLGITGTAATTLLTP